MKSTSNLYENGHSITSVRSQTQILCQGGVLTAVLLVCMVAPSQKCAIWPLAAKQGGFAHTSQTTSFRHTRPKMIWIKIPFQSKPIISTGQMGSIALSLLPSWLTGLEGEGEVGGGGDGVGEGEGDAIAAINSSSSAKGVSDGWNNSSHERILSKLVDKVL